MTTRASGSPAPPPGDAGRRAAGPSWLKDTERLRALLQLELSDSVEVERCELDRVRHDSDEDGAPQLVASYRIFLRDRATGRRSVQLYGARVSSRAPLLYQRLRDSRLTPVEVGPPIVHLRAAGMVLLAFPNDPKLPGLPGCLTREAIRVCLENAPDLGAAEVGEFTWTPLKYDPGRGCTLRFTVRVSRAGAPCELELVAKTHKGGRLAKTFDTMTRLWKSSVHRSDAWRPARPWFYDEDRRLLWQEALSGSGFWSLYPNLDVAAAFRRMARAAADLHRCGFAPTGRRLESLRDEGADVLARAYPELGRRHARILRGLETARGSLPRAAVVSLHGDFHPGQFLIGEDRVGLMDLDRARWGDPAADLGRFASHVLLHALERGIEPRAFEAPWEAFLEEYARSAPAWNGLGPVRWHVATELVGRRIHKLLDHLSERPYEKIDAILGVAEEHLEQLESAKSC